VRQANHAKQLVILLLNGLTFGRCKYYGPRINENDDKSIEIYTIQVSFDIRATVIFSHLMLPGFTTCKSGRVICSSAFNAHNALIKMAVTSGHTQVLEVTRSMLELLLHETCQELSRTASSPNPNP
jgi:hypothetical protein